MTNADTDRQSARSSAVRHAGLAGGLVLAVAVYLALSASELAAAGRWTAGVGVLMAVWWVTEALPIAATALVPIVLFPLLGVATVDEATAPYADDVIFLFMGGFMAGLAMQRWDLHRRFALNVFRLCGSEPRRLVAGFMGTAAILSMWVSNTATVIMMLPIGTSLIDLILERGGDRIDPRDRRNFGVCLLLGTAYGASIGGVGTLIGTPPNGLLRGYLANAYGQEISFGLWLRIGLPVVFVFLPIAWLLLTRVSFPTRLVRIAGAAELIRDELNRLGPMSAAERRVLIVCASMALGWMLRPLIVRLPFVQSAGVAIEDSMIAIGGALLLFVVPAGGAARGERLLSWEWAVKLPWGILILFGGGLSLAAAMRTNKVAEFIGNALADMEVLGTFGLVLLLVAIVIFLTELTSNTATTAALLPVFGALAVTMKVHPYLLLLPMTIVSSFAFMLPVATPPNAVVFGSGRVTIAQMARAGLWLNLAGIIVVTLFVVFAAGTLLGLDLAVFPDWAEK